MYTSGLRESVGANSIGIPLLLRAQQNLACLTSFSSRTIRVNNLLQFVVLPLDFSFYLFYQQMISEQLVYTIMLGTGDTMMNNQAWSPSFQGSCSSKSS